MKNNTVKTRQCLVSTKNIIGFNLKFGIIRLFQPFKIQIIPKPIKLYCHKNRYQKEYFQVYYK